MIALTALLAPIMFIVAGLLDDPRDANGKLVPQSRRTFRSILISMLRN